MSPAFSIMRVESVISEGAAPQHVSRAILIYEHTGTFGNNSCLATVHDVFVSSENNRPVIGSGELLERQTLADILRKMSDVPTARTLLPANLLFGDQTRLLWWAPACRYPIYFSTADKAFNADVHGKVVAHPPLLFCAKPEMLSVWALPQNERPEASTKVCVAPYYNLYDSGAMCRGDVKLPVSLDPSTIAGWESVFYDSRFTHTNLRQSAMTLFPGGHNALWRAMVALSDTEPFPLDMLWKTDQSVGAILEGR